jgi:hypothetical protein
MTTRLFKGSALILGYSTLLTSHTKECLRHYLSLLPIMQSSNMPPDSAQPIDWDHILFNQLGLLTVRDRIGAIQSDRGFYQRHRSKFDATDITWFASGLSSKVLHLTQTEFPAELMELRNGSPAGSDGSSFRKRIRNQIQRLTFDLVCIITACIRFFSCM